MDTYRLRRKLQITQTDLAQLVGVHPHTVSCWECGTKTWTPFQLELMRQLDDLEIPATVSLRSKLTSGSFPWTLKPEFLQ